MVKMLNKKFKNLYLTIQLKLNLKILPCPPPFKYYSIFNDMTKGKNYIQLRYNIQLYNV